MAWEARAREQPGLRSLLPPGKTRELRPQAPDPACSQSSAGNTPSPTPPGRYWLVLQKRALGAGGSLLPAGVRLHFLLKDSCKEAAGRRPGLSRGPSGPDFLVHALGEQGCGPSLPTRDLWGRGSPLSPQAALEDSVGPTGQESPGTKVTWHRQRVQLPLRPVCRSRPAPPADTGLQLTAPTPGTQCPGRAQGPPVEPPHHQQSSTGANAQMSRRCGARPGLKGTRSGLTISQLLGFFVFVLETEPWNSHTLSQVPPLSSHPSPYKCSPNPGKQKN